MELLVKLWANIADVYSVIGAIYLTAHIILPHQMLHPATVVISCTESGCQWEAKAKDRGGFFTQRLLNRLKARHKAHFLKAHPDQEWTYG